MCTRMCKDQLYQASECRVPLGGHGRDWGGFLLPSRPRAPAWGSCMESDQAAARAAAWRPDVLPVVGPAPGGPRGPGSETSCFCPRCHDPAKGQMDGLF